MNCRLELISDTAIEQYWFSPNGHVSATLGTKNGPVCAPLYQYKALTNDSIQIFDDKGSIAVWSNIQVQADRMQVERAGEGIMFRIERKRHWRTRNQRIYSVSSMRLAPMKAGFHQGSLAVALRHNKRMKLAHCVRPTRKSEALMLATYARR
jgi:hypothetical protein